MNHPNRLRALRFKILGLLVSSSLVMGCASLFPERRDLGLSVVSSPATATPAVTPTATPSATTAAIPTATISKDSVLIKINGSVLPVDRLQVLLNGRDVTASFAPDAKDGKLTGLITGLQLGSNLLIAQAQSPGDTHYAGYSRLEIIHYAK